MNINGTIEPGYEKVREAFAEGQADDPGAAQLAVHRDGRLVVDLWTGNVFSSSHSTHDLRRLRHALCGGISRLRIAGNRL